MRSKLFAEFWYLVLLVGTCTLIYVVVRGWLGDRADILGLMIGFAGAVAGLLGVAYRFICPKTGYLSKVLLYKDRLFATPAAMFGDPDNFSPISN